MPQPAAPRLKRPQALREYVAGGRSSSTIPQALSNAADDVQREIGPEIYERMLRDPDVSAAIEVLKRGILADGVQILPAVNKKAPEFAQAKEISDFCGRAIEGLQRPIVETLEMMLDAMAFGHKVAEVVYHVPVDGPDAYRMTLQAIKVKPRSSTAFVVDPYFNVLGFIYAAPGRSTAVGGSSLTDLSSVLPREKFLVLTVRPKDEDPRGQSMLRPAYNAWNLKQQTWPEYLRYLLQMAFPGLVGICSENASKEHRRNADGTLLTDGDGNAVEITPTEAMLDALLQFRNGTALGLPHGSDVKPIEVDSEGQPFINAFELFGAQITMAILLQALATRDAKHQTKASTGEQTNILDLLIWALKGAVARSLQADILRNLVRYNFGEDAARTLTPQAFLGDSARKDWSRDASAAATLINTSALVPSQVEALLTQLGLPEPEDGEEPIERANPEPMMDPEADPDEDPEEEGDDE